MATQADKRRVQKLRALVFQGSAEGWSNEQFDEALQKLYRKPRAPAKSK